MQDEVLYVKIEEAEKRNGQRFDAQEKAVQAALAAAEKAVTKAEVAAEKRFESVNEFRKTLSDQTASFLTRNEYNLQHQALSEKMDDVTVRMNLVERSIGELKERSAGRSDIWGILTGGIAIVVSIAVLAVAIIK